MQNVTRTLAGVLLAFFALLSPVVSYAQATCKLYSATYGGNETGWLPSASAVCSALQPMVQKNFPGSQVQVRFDDYWGNCAIDLNGSPGSGGSLGVRQKDGPCNDECPAGSTLVNATVGWAKGPGIRANEEAKLSLPPMVMAQQNGGAYCRVTLDLKNPVECWHSQTPSPTGLYRLSCDYSAERGGKTDATQDPQLFDVNAPQAAANNLAPAPPCDGDFGTINNKPVCVARLPEASQSHPPEMDDAELKAGNPVAGSGGRIPTTGNGTPAGGPPTASDGTVIRAGAVGAGGSGNGKTGDGNGKTTTEAGKEQLNCGAPGQAKCKIDETGTPEGKGVFDEATKAAKSGHDKVLETINGAKDKTAPAWSFSFQLPTGCTPINFDVMGIKTLTLDPCQYQGMIHDIMAMIWLATSAWCCIGMVGRTVQTS